MANPATRHEAEAPRRSRRVAAGLAGAAFGALAVAGLLLWWRHGEAVFSHYLLAAVAWCF